LRGRDPQSALYVGDNVDDALAARAACVPFVAILPDDAFGYRERARQFRELAALALLPRATAVNGLLSARHRS
jgi:phosphoglycolate phosphatase-like HAD superfamily hydrolase